jgi:hypothetical protein
MTPRQRVDVWSLNPPRHGRAPTRPSGAARAATDHRVRACPREGGGPVMTLRCQAMTLRGLAELPVRSFFGTYTTADGARSEHLVPRHHRSPAQICRLRQPILGSSPRMTISPVNFTAG